MRALQLIEWGRPAELREVARPVPGPGQVLIRIAGSGACQSDLRLMERPEPHVPWRLPFTLGHENAGRVEAVGLGVFAVEPGDAVVVYGRWGCGQCRACRLGRENHCAHASDLGVAGGGLGLDGGMADFMLVPHVRLLVPIGELDPVLAAPLADAALTPYHAIARSRDRLVPGTSAVVIGCGGVGQMAVQLVRATTSATVIAVDVSREKLARAGELGAHELVAAGDGAAHAIRRATGGEGAALVLDTVGAERTLALGAKSLRPEGRLVVIGSAMGELALGFFAVPYGAEVATSYWGTASELVELIELARRGRILVDVERFPLERALDAYDKLRRGAIRGRAVIVP